MAIPSFERFERLTTNANVAIVRSSNTKEIKSIAPTFLRIAKATYVWKTCQITLKRSNPQHINLIYVNCQYVSGTLEVLCCSRPTVLSYRQWLSLSFISGCRIKLHKDHTVGNGEGVVPCKVRVKNKTDIINVNLGYCIVYSTFKDTVAWDGFCDHIIVSKKLDKDKNFFNFGELWLLLAYSESAPRFFNYLWGLY